MKTPAPSLLRTLIAGLVVSSTMAIISGVACGGEVGGRAQATSQSDQSKRATPKVATRTEKVEITGSRIPRAARRVNWSSDVELAVTIIDRKQLDRLGGSTLAESLRKVPMIR